LKVTRSASFRTVDVVADGSGLSSRAGTVLLALTAQRLGLTDGLCGALAGTRERRSANDPGRVLCDLAVMAADGGSCVSDLAVLAGQGALFGSVASVSTARRVLLKVGESELERIRQARALARERAWNAGAAPDRVILDFDATPISIHSEKEMAAGHYRAAFSPWRSIGVCKHRHQRVMGAPAVRPVSARINKMPRALTSPWFRFKVAMWPSSAPSAPRTTRLSRESRSRQMPSRGDCSRMGTRSRRSEDEPSPLAPTPLRSSTDG
jgi:Transposase DDE domain group 1